MAESQSNKDEQKSEENKDDVLLKSLENQDTSIIDTNMNMENMNDFTKQFDQDVKMREFVQKFTPESRKNEVEKEKLIILRRWF